MASRGIVGAGLIAVMLLTACGGRHDEASGLPGALASASPTRAAPTVTSSPTPSATTSDGQAALRASAEQFVRDYFRLFNQANHEARPELVAGLFLPSCRQCHKSISFVQRDAGRGWHLEGNQIVVLEARLRHLDPTFNRATVRVVTRADPGRVVDKAGKVVDSAESWAAAVDEMKLLRRGQTWILEDMRFVRWAQS